jgi:hypothetical protein
MDSGGAEASPIDASDATGDGGSTRPCTPWPDGGFTYYCTNGFPAQVPGQICVIHGGGSYFPESTPAACSMCQEDFNCTCVMTISNQCDAGLCGCRLGGASAIAGCTIMQGEVMLACQY